MSKNKIIFLLSFLLSLTYSNIIPSDYIISLNDNNFEEAFSNYKNLFIEFYVTYCTYCISFYKNFEETSKLFNNENITFVKVNLEKNEKLIKKFKIDYDPYYLLLKKDENFSRIYKGPYNIKEFEFFIRKHLYNSVFEIKKIEEFEKYFSNKNPSIIYLKNDNVNNENFEIYNNFSLSEDKYHFFSLIKSNESLNYFNITKENQNLKEDLILIIKNFDNFHDEIIIKKSPIITYKFLFNLIRTYAYPNIIKFNDQSKQLIFNDKKPSLILFKYTNLNNKSEENFKKICSEIKKNIQCIISGLMSQDEPKLGDLIGITNSDLPIFFIIDTRVNITLYKFEIKNNEFDYFLLKNFINKFINNTLEKYIRSEKFDEKYFYQEPIFKLIGNNFEKEIKYNNHSNEDYVVLFFKNSCIKCQMFYSIYQKIAFKYSLRVNKHIKFFKIDIQLNDLPNDYYIEKIPFVYFYKAGSNNYIKLNYDEVLYEKDLNDFILKYTSFPLKEVTMDEIKLMMYKENHPDKNDLNEDL